LLNTEKEQFAEFRKYKLFFGPTKKTRPFIGLFWHERKRQREGKGFFHHFFQVFEAHGNRGDDVGHDLDAEGRLAHEMSRDAGEGIELDEVVVHGFLERFRSNAFGWFEQDIEGVVPAPVVGEDLLPFACCSLKNFVPGSGTAKFSEESTAPLCRENSTIRSATAICSPSSSGSMAKYFRW